MDVGGHRLHIWCTGSGGPAVIYESGLGGGAFGWTSVKPEVAKFTEVCTYDRAGMGYSDSGPMPRTSRQIASELAVLLEKAVSTTPVILVGSSFGGYNVRVFASEYTDRVTGLCWSMHRMRIRANVMTRQAYHPKHRHTPGSFPLPRRSECCD